MNLAKKAAEIKMETGSRWRKIKHALGLTKCFTGSGNHVNTRYETAPPSERRSDAALLSPPSDVSSYATPRPSAPKKLMPSKSLNSSSSKKICAICLASMRRGDGQAIFTAECSHSFHFHCIASNVKHGNKICPVCRATWKDIPLQGPSIESAARHERRVPVNWPQNDHTMTVIRRMPPLSYSSRSMPLGFQSPEPDTFDDDEPLEHKSDPADRLVPTDFSDREKVVIRAFTEVSSVPRSSQVDSFTVLLHLKAPCSNSWHSFRENDLHKMSGSSRAPVDLVTVLDTSGSMAGTKLALLKRAMGFLIQNLGPNDRLAVISFSSAARRVFPLQRMSEAGRQQALQAVNSLVACGGTNIAEGLRKGAKIMEDRKERNPIANMILLSDGQDTYTVCASIGTKSFTDYQLLLPSSIRPDEATPGFKIPIHAFGFGADHDASAMHSISEMSGGTFLM